MVVAARCWGRPVEDPGLAEELRRQEVVEEVGSTAAGRDQVGGRAEDMEEDRGEGLDRHT